LSGLREIYNALMMEGWQAGDGIAQEDALQLTARMNELNFEPGTEYLYCNTAYMLLADIVAKVSGVPFPEFMAESVFGPAGMTHTTIMASFGQSIPGAAESYGPAEGGGFVRIFDNSTIQGAGGIYTTVDDLAAWMSNYADARVGGPEVIQQMQQRGVLASGDTLGYAFGLTIGESRGLRTIGHGGSSAGYRSSFTYSPDVDGGVIVLSNFAGFDGSISGKVAEIFFGEHMEPAPEAAAGQEPTEDPEEAEAAEEVEVAEEILASLAGRYYSPELETVYTLVVEDGKLMGKHRRHDDFELTATEEWVFRGPNFFSEVRFERNQAGVVTGMRASNGRVRNLLFERLSS
jgi:CubicO group peptidase (beta-lactamase class C family)